MTDITELTSVQKNANIHRLSRLIAYASNDELRQMAVEVEHYTDQLIEALEKAQQERENWRTSFDNERFRADKLKAHIDEMTEEQTASINELSRIIQKEVKAKREAEKRIAELEESNAQIIQSRDHYKRMTEEGLKRLAKSRTVTVKLPDDEDGQAYGFGKWANGKLPATAGTMTIAYCEDAWRTAFEVFSSAAGIKVEIE